MGFTNNVDLKNFRYSMDFMGEVIELKEEDFQCRETKLISIDNKNREDD